MGPLDYSFSYLFTLLMEQNKVSAAFDSPTTFGQRYASWKKGNINKVSMHTCNHSEQEATRAPFTEDERETKRWVYKMSIMFWFSWQLSWGVCMVLKLMQWDVQAWEWGCWTDKEATRFTAVYIVVLCIITHQRYSDTTIFWSQNVEPVLWCKETVGRDKWRCCHCEQGG